MELLRELRPADIMGFSCLVSALAELCFSIHPCYVPYPIAAASSSSSSSGGEGGSGDGSLVVPLGAVDDKLRIEAGAHLLSLLRPSPSPALPQRPVPSSSTATVAEVVCRRFVMDICEQPLQLRCAALRLSSPAGGSLQDGLGAGEGEGEGEAVGEEESGVLHEFVEQLCGRSSLSPSARLRRGSIAGAEKDVLPSPSKGASLGSSFFSSLGSSFFSAPSAAPSPAPTPSQSSLRKFDKLPLHLGISSAPRDLPCGLSAAAASRWSCFYGLDMELQVLSAVMEVRGYEGREALAPARLAVTVCSVLVLYDRF